MEKRKFPNNKAVALESKNFPYQLVFIFQSTSLNYKYTRSVFQGKAGDDFKAEIPNYGFLKACLETKRRAFFIFKVNFLVFPIFYTVFFFSKEHFIFLCYPAKPGLNSEQANQHNVL